jgi:tetratricopeptide (TPR) repeat protein
MKILRLLAICYTIISCGNTAPLSTSSTKPPLSKEKRLEYENKSIQYYTRGSLLLNNNAFSQALNEFYQALLYDENSVDIYQSIAKCLINLNQLETAEINLLKAKKLQPENVETLLMLGGVQTQLKKHAEAIANYTEVNRIEPSNVKAFELLCFLYTYTDQNDTLVTFIQDKVKFIEVSAELAYSIATYYYKAEDMANTRLWVQKSLQIDPTYNSAKLLQSQLDLQDGKQDDALASFQKIYKENPENYRLLYRIVEILRDEERFHEIIDLLKDKKGLGEQFLLLHGEAYYKIEDYTAAQRIFAELTLTNYNPYFIFVAADTELKLNNFETAHAYFSDMIRQSPEQPQGYYGAGYSLIQQKQFEDAEKVLREGLVKSNNNSILYALLSETLIELNRYSEATNYIQDLLRESPNDANTMAQVADFYQKTENYEKADSYYEKAISIDSENALILNNYSYSLSKRGIKLDRALELIKKALVKEPNNSFYLDTMGWVYYKMKKYNLAQAFVEKSIAVRKGGKESAIVYEHLGDIFLAQGNVEKAIHNWKKALEFDSSRNEVKEKLKKHSL